MAQEDVNYSNMPVRRCVACGDKFFKGDLLRIAVSQEGPVVIDVTGKSLGRGAYLCLSSNPDHYRRGRDQLSHALNRDLTEKEWVNLAEYLETLTLVE